MKIVAKFPILKEKEHIEYEKDLYARLVYKIGNKEKIVWEGVSFDGEVDSSKLEEEYQKIIEW